MTDEFMGRFVPGTRSPGNGARLCQLQCPVPVVVRYRE
jgi:hypothetical protein